jgi:hypothetical protein
MKSRLASYVSLGRRILVFTLLAVIATAAAGMQSAPAISSAEGRKAIQARVVLDKSTIERMLAPDVCVQTPDQKLTRQELIDAIFSHPYTLTRFDATVLTVEPRANEWVALVLEKLEGEINDNSGKTREIYVMAVARDGWGKLNDNEWTLLWSEQLGQQQWKDERPPIANW